MDAKTLLLAGLIVIAVAFLAFWYTTVTRQRARSAAAAAPTRRPNRAASASAFVANFFDTLGIGSYATTTSMLRFWKVIPDEKIPGTLNVGYVLPTVVQARHLHHDRRGRVRDAGDRSSRAAVVGAWLGAGVVAGLPRRKVQIGMGIALLGAATLMLFSLLGIGPAPGVALGLTGAKLGHRRRLISVVLGALMMLGIGYLRAVPDHDQPARDEPDGGLSRS